MSFSTAEGSHRHVGSGRVQVTLAVILNHHFHLLPPISASFPLSGSQCSCRDAVRCPGLLCGSTPVPWGTKHIFILETASPDFAAQQMLVLQWRLLCLLNSRNPALRNGTEPHTRDKLIQQQWHETVLFFILLLLSPHEAASLNSYFIYYWLPRTIIYKGGLRRKRWGKVDGDL